MEKLKLLYTKRKIFFHNLYILSDIQQKIRKLFINYHFSRDYIKIDKLFTTQ